MTTGANPIPVRLTAAGTAGCRRARSSTANLTRFRQTIPAAGSQPGSIGRRNPGACDIRREDVNRREEWQLCHAKLALFLSMALRMVRSFLATAMMAAFFEPQRAASAV